MSITARRQLGAHARLAIDAETLVLEYPRRGGHGTPFEVRRLDLSAQWCAAVCAAVTRGRMARVAADDERR
eukprot:8193604-Pyramimonas_sp.AAC.2